MHYHHAEPSHSGFLRLYCGEAQLEQQFQARRNEAPLSVLWNRGSIPKEITVDGMVYELGVGELMTLNTDQSFAVAGAESLVAWQFNRHFYCIIDHDPELSCVGLLFYGSLGVTTIALDGEEQERLNVLVASFEAEFRQDNPFGGEMLLLLLKRLIVVATRRYKEQYAHVLPKGEDLDLLRRFALLVEQHYRSTYRVQEYARLLHKSPKTIANLFALQSGRTPLQMIHDRRTLEARRLLLFTEATGAEIAYELGFSDPAQFSTFFKKQTGLSPSAFRQNRVLAAD